MKHRSKRVSSLIEKELSKIIIRDIEAPDCLMTITEVSVDEKLEGATVYVSVLPTDKSAAALKVLNKNISGLQYSLMKKLNIKPMPRISFKIDRGVENAARVERILSDK